MYKGYLYYNIVPLGVQGPRGAEAAEGQHPPIPRHIRTTI
jgi:hypothetical protein